MGSSRVRSCCAASMAASMVRRFPVHRLKKRVRGQMWLVATSELRLPNILASVRMRRRHNSSASIVNTRVGVWKRETGRAAVAGRRLEVEPHAAMPNTETEMELRSSERII